MYFDINNINNADHYKVTHFTFMEEGTTKAYSYVEARAGGVYDYTVFFGLQAYLKAYLSKPVNIQMVDEMEIDMEDQGIPFNREGWEYIIGRYDGYLPLEIKALPEGTISPLGTVLVTVENTDDQCAWLTSYIETAMLRAIWYATTVATHSREVKQAVKFALELSGDVSLLPFKLVDFGSRGVSSAESCGIGGAAHLINFGATDNILATKFAKVYYNGSFKKVTIPATEHAVTCSWKREHELDFYKNILKVHAGKMVSVVCDTYDLDAAIRMWGSLKDDIIASGCTIVIRPDSGTPSEIVLHVLQLLEELFGTTTNRKGYRVLPDYIRMIQGDGITLNTVKEILKVIMDAGFSADNVTFGSGGWLLQQVNRDTERFAMKGSWVLVNGEERNIAKDPQTDHSKASKSGRFKVISVKGVITTVAQNDPEYIDFRDCLELVYRNGKVMRTQEFADIQALAA